MLNSHDISALAQTMVSMLGGRFRTEVISCQDPHTGHDIVTIKVCFAGITALFYTMPYDGIDSVYSAPTHWDPSLELDREYSNIPFDGESFWEDECWLLGMSGTVPEIIALAKTQICSWLIRAGRLALRGCLTSTEEDSVEVGSEEC